MAGEGAEGVPMSELAPSDERQVREAAAHEWDQTVPRWGLTRDRFINWHVRMAEGAARRRKGRAQR